MLVSTLMICWSASPASAASRAVTQTAKGGSVRATIRYIPPADPTSDFRVEMTIVRHGRTASVGRVPPFDGHGGSSAQPVDLTVRDLDGDGEPEVVLDLYWGGAHCCFWTRVYHWVPSFRRYKWRTALWGDPGVELRVLAPTGRPEFVTANDAFAYEFTAFAFSALPIRTVRFDRGRFIETTTQHRLMIQSDAQRYWAAATDPNVDDNRGLLAAWAADRCLLGDCRTVLTAVRRNVRTDQWTSSWDANPDAYVAHLERFLQANG
jgi:hypothetical protein